MSDAVALPVLDGNVTALQAMVIFAGQLMVGTMLSSTKMLCTQVLVFPQSSAAIHVRVMVNSSMHPPAVAASENVMVGVPSQLSDAVAEPPVFAGAVLLLH